LPKLTAFGEIHAIQCKCRNSQLRQLRPTRFSNF